MVAENMAETWGAEAVQKAFARDAYQSDSKVSERPHTRRRFIAAYPTNIPDTYSGIFRFPTKPLLDAIARAGLNGSESGDVARIAATNQWLGSRREAPITSYTQLSEAQATALIKAIRNKDVSW